MVICSELKINCFNFGKKRKNPFIEKNGRTCLCMVVVIIVEGCNDFMICFWCVIIFNKIK